MQMNASIAITTYQAGKVVMISAKDEHHLVQLPRTFNKAMGLAIDGNKMAVATKKEIVILRDSPELGFNYPKQPKVYDHFYVPRATFYTGEVDIHDIHFGNQGELYAINTSFSSLCIIDDKYSFTPIWKPKFISTLESLDKCHLNGLAMENGKPRFVTALGSGDTHQSWRQNITQGGVLIDLALDEIVLNNLPMPHSPVLIGDKLYLLLSATGDFVVYDINTKAVETVKNLGGFTRGLSIYGDYAFIGMSKLRKNSSTFNQLKIAEKATFAGVIVVHIPSKAVVANLSYETSVDEIYGVQVLSNHKRPGILNTENDIHTRSLVLPTATFWSQMD